MATSANAYALPNPAMVDPYPIESVLAKDSASPGALLALYRADRGIAGEGYQHELDAQHDQVQRQLVATMANNAAERTVGAMAHPGGLAYMASQPAFSWMGLGGNQTGLADYATPDKILQYGNAVKPGAEGVKALADAGYFPPTGDVSNVTGLTVNQGTAIPVQAAIARGQSTPDTQGVMIPTPMGTIAGKLDSAPVKRYASDTEEMFQQRVADARRSWQLANQAGKPLPGNAPPPPPATSTTPAQTETPPPPPPAASTDGSVSTTRYETPAESKAIISKPAVPGRTSLAQNPQPASAPAPEGNTTVGQLVVNGKLQQMAQQFVRSLPPDIRDDVLKEIMTSPNGGNAPLYPAKGGGFVLKGASGRYYPTPIQVTP